MKAEILDHANLMQASEFIAELNALPECHIGYLGTSQNDIYQSLEEMNRDAVSAAFIVWEGDALAGFLGADADLNKGTAELWGPFIQENELMRLLWEKALHYFEGKLHTYFIFADTSNHAAAEFASKNGFRLQSAQTYMELKDNSSNGLRKVSLLPIHFHSEFIHLHDTLFPHTYYSGKEIIERMNDDHKVYTSLDADGLNGYLYAEYNREEKEGSIEFIGVDPNKRMKGIGRNLLEMAIHDLFMNSGAKSIKLCVETTNEKALSIYKKAGFKVERSLNFYKLDIRE
ncbi:GNAT family N-acetyltransferase [Bacillus sp. CMF12]|uniref:GNAT family N-acetyltransferase n=1 Tax=Bacillaceae TaxID=186817 RepID=UPI001FB4A24A|nr:MULTISPECIES: GNAT family N-acetyltransferase [Bacillaceae]UOE57604.1 GNAT family N-acetyltransferase [Cytobacillus oceanisediminis]USK52065.1 GNAT family N-acetyltransferase [Bacillus sp. CMF12]